MTKEQIQEIIDDPKEFLLKGKKVKEDIKLLNARIDSWRQLAESVTVTAKPESGANTGGKSKGALESAVCNIVDIENDINEKVKALIDIEKAIQEAINLFVKDRRYVAVLELMYLNDYSEKAIGRTLNYGADWVCRLHSAAIKEMKENAEKAV